MKRKITKGLFILIGVLMFLSNMGMAQTNIRVTGKVSDADNQPLAGSSVTEKGTTNSVMTDENGQYTISVRDRNAVLIFSFISFESQEVQIGSRTVLDIHLAPQSGNLSEVVVIGYGSTRSKDVTGSVKSIKSTDFNKGIINSPEQLLQGKVAGVTVTSASGEPGASVNINVRGPGGVRSGSTPLFVVDGFPLDNSGSGAAINPLTFMNPDDIAAIDVLKDASATAIYGARGANGVVLITTKRGKEGASNLNYNVSVGVSKMARKIDVFTADEFRTELRNLGVDFIDDGGNTDWQEEISRQALTQNHNLSLSGGSKKLVYFGSVGIQKQQGILKGSDLDRYNARMNVSQKLWDDKLTIDVNLSASSNTNKRPPFQSMMGSALSANPTYKPYGANGALNRYADGTNPLLTLALEQDYTQTQRILGNISPSLALFKNLVYKLNFGIDYTNTQRDLQTLPNEEPLYLGSYDNINVNNTNRLIENYLTYTLNSGKSYGTALLGHSYQKIFLQGRGFGIDKFPLNGIEPRYNPGLGQDLSLDNNKPTGYAVVNELQSFFSRVNYQYADKYLATATVRIDGSSKFGSNNKYGVFPSFSLGWRLSEESFLKSSPVISDLKLRAGWGLTGNQEIPSKITQALFTSSVSGTTSYPLGNTPGYPAGTTYSRLANPDIQWEVSSQTDIGLDFDLFKGALSGSIDYFNKISKDILLEVIPADPVQPAGTYWTNVADMRIINKGVELDLIYRKKVNNNFSYEIGGNITFIDNVVRDSPYSVIPSGSASGSGLTSATINGYLNGYPIGTFYLKELIGFDEQGLAKYRDTDGDGIESDKDRIAAGTALPNRIYNLTGSISYRRFDLSANFNGIAGNKVYDNTANANFYKLRLSKGVNTTAEAVEYPEESLNNSAPISTRFLKDGAYFRLNNAVVGYNFDTKKLGLEKYVPSLRLSLTGQNLFVITKYNGFDPDVNTDRAINGVLSYGIDYLTYPKAKSYILSLQVGL